MCLIAFSTIPKEFQSPLKTTLEPLRASLQLWMVVDFCFRRGHLVRLDFWDSWSEAAELWCLQISTHFSFPLPPVVNLVLQFNNICPLPYITITWRASQDFFPPRLGKQDLRLCLSQCWLLKIWSSIIIIFFLAFGIQLASWSLEIQLEI